MGSGKFGKPYIKMMTINTAIKQSMVLFVGILSIFSLFMSIYFSIYGEDGLMKKRNKVNQLDKISTVDNALKEIEKNILVIKDAQTSLEKLKTEVSDYQKQHETLKAIHDMDSEKINAVKLALQRSSSEQIRDIITGLLIGVFGSLIAAWIWSKVKKHKPSQPSPTDAP